MKSFLLFEDRLNSQRYSHRFTVCAGGTIGPSSGIDIGSEMSGDVYNVMVRNLHFKEVMFASRIKSGRGRGGEQRLFCN